MIKEDIRRLIIDRRKKEDKLLLEDLSLKIIENIKRNINLDIFNTFMFYYPMKGEPNLIPLAEELIRRGCSVAFPVLKENKIIPFAVKDINSFAKKSYGVYEPLGGEEIGADSIEIVFVPGLAFGKNFYRVGFGKGFYDRFLKGIDAYKVGVAFDFQLFDSVPYDEWDVPMDAIVTPSDILKRR